MANIKTLYFFLSLTLCSCAAKSQQGGGLGQSSNDTLIKTTATDTKGFKPVANINNFYRLHVGLSYNITTAHEDGMTADQHKIGLNYSLSEKSFHPYYQAFFPQAIGGWNLSLVAGYDGIRRVNFYGVGNESVRNPANEKFNWLRTENLYANVGITKVFSARHTVEASLLYDGIRVMDDDDRIISRAKGLVEPAGYNRQTFLGGRISYGYEALNSRVIATKGIVFTSTASYTENIERRTHSFARLTTDVEIFLPLTGAFSMVTRVGAATLTGRPDFYQLNTIGGGNTVRGYQRFRFYGKTSGYNQNELRWLTTADTKIYKGQFGLFTLLDQGRVWHPGDASAKMHYGYGGGIILVPKNKYVITAAYAASEEDGRFHLNLRRIF